VRALVRIVVVTGKWRVLARVRLIRCVASVGRLCKQALALCFGRKLQSCSSLALASSEFLTKDWAHWHRPGDLRPVLLQRWRGGGVHAA
jgi:hypothetical protein